MVLKLEGNSEIGANVRSNLCYLICLQQMVRSRAVAIRIFFRKDLHACVTCSDLPSNINRMVEISRGFIQVEINKVSYTYWQNGASRLADFIPLPLNSLAIGGGIFYLLRLS